MEKLSAKLISKLETDSLKLEYRYFGKDLPQVNKELHSFKDSSFDGLLLFTPVDTAFLGSESFFDISRQSRIRFASKASVNYHQNFNIFLYLPDKQNLTWHASVKVNCEINKSWIFRLIVKRIAECFTKNKYIK